MNTHRFRSLVFDVEVATRAQASAIQQRLSRFGHDILPELIDEGLAGQTLITGRVELDLGCLDSDKMERQMAERLLKLLRSLSPRDSPQGERGTQPDAAPRRILSDLTLCLTRGQLPWTMPAQPGGIAELIRRMQEVPAPELRDWWQRVRADREAVMRLALAVNRPEFQRFLAMIGRDDPNLADSGDGLRLRLGWPQDRFDPIWRMAVLRDAPARGLTRGVTELAILKNMQDLLRDRPRALGFVAPTVDVGGADDPATANTSAQNTPESAPGKTPPDHKDLLAGFLSDGFAPDVAQADLPALIAAFRTESKAGADGLARSLRGVEEQPALIAWMIHNLPGEDLERIVATLCPAGAMALRDLLRRSRLLSAPLNRQIWRAALWVALQDQAAADDPASVTRRLLERVNIRCGVSPANILALLTSAGSGTAEPSQPELRAVLATLARDHPGVEITTSASVMSTSGADKSASGHLSRTLGADGDPSSPAAELPMPWSRDDLEAQVGAAAATLLLYLRYGVGAPPSPTEADAQLQHVLSHGGVVTDGFLSCLRYVAAARTRLATSVSSAGRVAVISALGRGSWSVEIIEPVETAVARLPGISAATARMIVSRAIFDAICTQPPYAQQITLIRRLVMLLDRTVARTAEDISMDLAGWFDKSLPELAQELRRQARLRPHVPVSPPATPTRAAEPGDPNPVRPIDKTEQGSAATQEPWLVADAGSVLLWPFLPRYFAALSMLDDRSFASDTHQHRAVRLVHFLATGEQDAADHLLALPKVLCGLSPDTPIWPAELFTDAETDLSADLLHAVTQAWPGLENTSVSGLRQTFLARTGLLQPKSRDADATLRVETGPYDMLLERLTWPVSVVSLDWMVGPLHVRWGET